MIKVLLVDDDPNFAATTKELLETISCYVDIADSVSDGRKKLRGKFYDLLMLDVMLSDGSGFEILDNIAEQNRPRHVAIITGHDFIKNLIESLYGKKVSYLIKPIDFDELKHLVELAENHDSGSKTGIKRHFGFLIGESPQMKEVYTMIDKVAKTNANVLIQGESGVGKELVAASIHRCSEVSGDFVAANCGAIPSELIGSELFGHEKGAFTGAISRKKGIFEQAELGTLFLDEITEMPFDLQPNLLRVLESGIYKRIGSSDELEVKSRVISATNRVNADIFQHKHLREDLYFRLAVFPISVPPLRERIEDIPLLARAFLEQLNEENNQKLSLEKADLTRLKQYDWPGNVRELKHCIHRAFIMSDTNQDYLKIPSELGIGLNKNSEDLVAVGKSLAEVERELIKVTLKSVDGDKPKAAEMLGISLKTLYNRLKSIES